jgi:putative Holliday junction resolvase
MGRIVAIDYGTKRVGLAATDPLKIIASAIDTIDEPKVIDFLKAYIKLENVELFVVGEPFRFDGSPAQSTGAINKFIDTLKKNFPNIPIDREDESFSSKEAFQTMIDSGITKKKRRDKAIIDRVSATIILKNYMENNGL